VIIVDVIYEMVLASEEAHGIEARLKAR